MEVHTPSEVEFVDEQSVEDLDADRGASLVEYALLIALIALICFAAVALLGTSASTGLSNAATSLAN